MAIVLSGLLLGSFLQASKSGEIIQDEEEADDLQGANSPDESHEEDVEDGNNDLENVDRDDADEEVTYDELEEPQR